MKYAVAWLPSAQRQLAQLWVNAPDRAAVTAAANAIDATLLRDPATKGEARSGANRVLFEPPLAVYFRVSEPDRLVTVWAVWRYDPQP